MSTISSLLVSLSVLLPLQEAKKPSVKKSLEEVAQKYHIEIVHEAPTFPAKTHWGPITGKKGEPKNLEQYVPLFVREFTLLPVSLIQKSKLKRIILCEELSFVGQRRNAVPDWEHDDLYLEVSRGAKYPRYLATVIHHEFFHIVDYKDDGLVYKDDAWSALNPKDFKYGNGGKNAQSNGSTSMLTTKFPGFLTHYGTTGVEEDKAELYAHLIVNSAVVKDRIKTDAVLKAKVARMKSLLKSFCPSMNDDFWKKIEKVDRPVGF